MKIIELVIRNFGKLTDRKVPLSDGINLIYGENESGKSTIHTFIRGMLFGIERGRGRASVNDTYSRYEPWENPNYYSGKLRFESGGKHFLLDRNFDKYTKKAELICEDDGESLSVADGDLKMILGELSENVYENTVSVGQLHAEPGEPLWAELQNYAMNYYASGDGDLNFDGALERLKERRREIDREIKEEFREKQQKRDKIEQEASFVWREVHDLRNEQENLRERIAHREELEKERKKSERESENNRVFDEIRPGKWRVHPLEIVFFIFAIVFVYIAIPKPWDYLVAIILALLCLIYTWNRMKVGKKQEKTEPEKILEEIMPEEEKIPLEKLRWEFERGSEELLDKETQYNNLREQLEEMHEMGEEYREKETKREAVDLVICKIQELSKDFQIRMKETLNALASDVLSEITGGKYTRLVMEDNLKLSVLCEGKKIPLWQLSRGTIEQIYLALRMAAAELLKEENYPVILDDTFAYYDDERLENTLRWLEKSGKQVLLFTCQKREEEAMKRLGIGYTKCEL